METTYQFENIKVKIIDNSNQEERRKRLEQAVIKFIKEVDNEKTKTKH